MRRHWLPPKVLFVVAAVFVLVHGAVAAFYESPHVTQLTWDTWKETVIWEEEMPWVVEVYAEWCDQCVDVKDTIQEVAKFGSKISLYNTGAVDGDVEGQIKLLYAKDGFPAILFFPPGRSVKPIPYHYDRDIGTLVEWVFRSLPNYVLRITGERHLRDYQSQYRDVPKLILFTENYVTPSTILALAFKYRTKMLVAHVVGPKGAPIGREFHVRHFPSIFAVTPGRMPEYIGSKLSFEQLDGFLEEFATDDLVGSTSKEVQAVHKNLDMGDPVPQPHMLTTGNFTDSISSTDKPWVVMYYHYWLAQYANIVNHWKRAIDTINMSGGHNDLPHVYAGAVNGDTDHGIFRSNNITQIPMLVAYDLDGNEVARKTSRFTYGAILKFIKKHSPKVDIEAPPAVRSEL